MLLFFTACGVGGCVILRAKLPDGIALARVLLFGCGVLGSAYVVFLVIYYACFMLVGIIIPLCRLCFLHQGALFLVCVSRSCRVRVGLSRRCSIPRFWS